MLKYLNHSVVTPSHPESTMFGNPESSGDTFGARPPEVEHTCTAHLRCTRSFGGHCHGDRRAAHRAPGWVGHDASRWSCARHEVARDGLGALAATDGTDGLLGDRTRGAAATSVIARDERRHRDCRLEEGGARRRHLRRRRRRVAREGGVRGAKGDVGAGRGRAVRAWVRGHSGARSASRSRLPTKEESLRVELAR